MDSYICDPSKLGTLTAASPRGVNLVRHRKPEMGPISTRSVGFAGTYETFILMLLANRLATQGVSDDTLFRPHGECNVILLRNGRLIYHALDFYDTLVARMEWTIYD